MTEIKLKAPILTRICSYDRSVHYFAQILSAPSLGPFTTTTFVGTEMVRYRNGLEPSWDISAENLSNIRATVPKDIAKKPSLFPKIYEKNFLKNSKKIHASQNPITTVL